MQFRKSGYDELDSNLKKLLDLAFEVKKNSYSPYSDYPVGAALTTPSGETFTGTNVENASYGLSVCAEVGAIQAAASAGFTKIKAIAVVGGVAEQEIIPTPCGRCRQLIMEFSEHGPENVRVVLANHNMTAILVTSIAELLPMPFGPVNLDLK